jgi:hypothetical protein
MTQRGSQREGESGRKDPDKVASLTVDERDETASVELCFAARFAAKDWMRQGTAESSRQIIEKTQ